MIDSLNTAFSWKIENAHNCYDWLHGSSQQPMISNSATRDVPSRSPSILEQ